jgi:PAS domain S-box-containing protein
VAPAPPAHFPIQQRPDVAATPARRSVAVLWLAATVAASIVGLFSLAFVTGSTSRYGLAAAALAVTGAVLAMGAAWRGLSAVAAWCTIAGVWGGGVVVLVAAGTASPAAAIFLVAVLLAAMLLGSRAVGAVAVVSLLVGIAVSLWIPHGVDAVAYAVMTERRFFVELELFAAVSALAVWWVVKTELQSGHQERLVHSERALSALRHAVDASRSGIAVTDRDGRLTYANRTALDMWGLTDARDAIGRRAAAFWADPEVAVAAARRLMEGRNIVTELRARRADGTVIDVEVSGTRVQDDDGSDTLIASLIDVTERNRAERQVTMERERTKAIVDHVLDIVIILDATGTIVFENAAVEQVLGFVPGERVGQNIMDHAHPDDRAVAGSAFASAMADPSRMVRLLLRFRHKDGSWRWLDTQGRNLSGEPAIGGILGVGRDVTEQRQMQARLEASERMETVGRLAGGLAHDFNNLLTAILGNAELAERTSNAGEVHRHLLGIVDSAERARELTRKLLGFARLEHAQPVVVDVRARLHDSRELMRRLLGEEVRVRIDLSEDPLHTVMDPVQFEQVTLNLAVNARDAMPDGGAYTVSASRIDVQALDPSFLGSLRPGPAVRLVVTDTGIGMSPDVQLRVFEPFFTTKEYGRGTGLGLSTVYGSVIHAGGALRVTSRIQQGTTFEILLPWIEAPDPAAEGTSSTEPTSMSGLVLIAEDDTAVRHLLEETLTGAGCRVISARNGLQGMTLATRHCADIALLVTDVVMPDVRGTELAAHFRRLKPNGRVIFVTGYSPDPTLQQQASSMDAPILQKPFRVAQLLAAVSERLNIP